MKKWAYRFFVSFVSLVVSILILPAYKSASGTGIMLPASGDFQGAYVLNDIMKPFVKVKTFEKVLYGLEGNYEVVEEISGKLEKDGGLDGIRLIALRHEGGVYDRKLLLEVIPPGKDSFVIALPEDVKGFHSSIEVKNFMSTAKSEILLTVNCGKQGERFLIISVTDKHGEVVLDTHAARIPAVIGRFFDNYRAEIIVQETGERAMIDLSPRKAAYGRNSIYRENGTLRSETIVWFDKFSRFESIDLDDDGIFEIKEVMDLSGVGRTDRIAYVEAALKYADNKWRVIDSWIAPAEDLNKIPLPKRIR